MEQHLRTLVLAIMFVLHGAAGIAQSLVQVGYFPFNGLFSVTGYDNYMLTGAGHLIDIQNPAMPQLTGNVSAGLCTSVVVDGQYAYFGRGMTPSVLIVDLTVPSAPISLGSLPLAASAGVFGIAVVGDVIYAANAEQGLASIDVSNPLTPELIQQLPFPAGEQARGVAILGDHAYVADGSGLKVVDISDPSDMEVLGSLGSGYVSVAISEEGSRLAVGQAGGGAIVFDLANPALPQVIYGVPEANGPAYRVQIMDDRLYVSSEQYGVRVYELGATSAPFLAGFQNATNGQTFSAHASGDLAFVTGLVNGAAILQWTDTGLEEVMDISSLHCYPIPACTTLNWTAADMTCDAVQIMDASGRSLLRAGIDAPSIDVSVLAPGVYSLILLKDGTPRHRSSFVKE